MRAIHLTSLRESSWTWSACNKIQRPCRFVTLWTCWFAKRKVALHRRSGGGVSSSTGRLWVTAELPLTSISGAPTQERGQGTRPTARPRCPQIHLAALPRSLPPRWYPLFACPWQKRKDAPQAWGVPSHEPHFVVSKIKPCKLKYTRPITWSCNLFKTARTHHCSSLHLTLW